MDTNRMISNIYHYIYTSTSQSSPHVQTNPRSRHTIPSSRRIYSRRISSTGQPLPYKSDYFTAGKAINSTSGRRRHPPRIPGTRLRSAWAGYVTSASTPSRDGWEEYKQDILYRIRTAYIHRCYCIYIQYTTIPTDTTDYC